jgi:hypothetical protein
VASAAVLPGAVLLCDRRLVAVTPSELPDHLHAEAAGRRILLHSMHSVVDALYVKDVRLSCGGRHAGETSIQTRIRVRS